MTDDRAVPKGWTRPKEVDGLKVEELLALAPGTFPERWGNASHRAVLEQWMRGYRPEELFDATGGPVPEIRDLHPVYLF